MLEFARTAPIDANYLRHVVDHLSRSARARSDSAPRARPRIARSPTSWPPRCAEWGSPRSRSSRCRVDGWRLLDARVAVAGRSGLPVRGDGRRPANRTARRARPARRCRHRRAAAARPRSTWPGASRCWTGAAQHSPISEIGLELGLRGAVGHHPQLSRRRAVLPVGGCARIVRLALVRRRAAVRDHVQGGRRGAPRAHRAATRRSAAHARRRPGARRRRAATSSATCPVQRAGAPIVIGAHHDGWFSAAFDNATGVAAMLAPRARARDRGTPSARTRSASRRARPRSTA